MINFSSSLLRAGFILALIIVFGTAGYVFVEGWPILDSFYMVIITITTTGFGEIHNLSSVGRVLTMVILVSGFVVYSAIVAQFMQGMISYDISERREKLMLADIVKMSDHTVVCGFGRMGEVICSQLDARGIPFVVIEKRPSLVKILRNKKFLFIEGDAAQDENLIKSGVERAKNLISVIDSDSDALYITIAGRSLNKDLYIVTRASEKSSETRLVRVGANKVILPLMMSGLQVAESIINPEVEDYFEIFHDRNDTRTWLQKTELEVKKNSEFVGINLEIIGKKIDHLLVVGVRTKDGQFLFKPGGQYIFKEGDSLITLAVNTQGPKEFFERKAG